MVLRDYWLLASSFKKKWWTCINLQDSLYIFSTRKSTLQTGPIWLRYYEWLASLKYLWITIELFPNGCMQDKTLENSTDIWWIKCVFVVRRFDEMMTNFVLNVCKSEPKFWANIIQHGDTCELLFSFYQSDFLWCCFYVLKQSFNYRIMCIYLYLYVNIIDSLFFSTNIHYFLHFNFKIKRF